MRTVDRWRRLGSEIHFILTRNRGFSIVASRGKTKELLLKSVGGTTFLYGYVTLIDNIKTAILKAWPRLLRTYGLTRSRDCSKRL